VKRDAERFECQINLVAMSFGMAPTLRCACKQQIPACKPNGALSEKRKLLSCEKYFKEHADKVVERKVDQDVPVVRNDAPVIRNDQK
jgi:hypothetical protein